MNMNRYFAVLFLITSVSTSAIAMHAPTISPQQILSSEEKQARLANFMSVCRQLHIECNEWQIDYGTLNLSSQLPGITPPLLHRFWNQLSQLSWLKTLYMDGNQLESIPDIVGSLNNLTFLFLNNNQIKTIPPWIGNLKNLTYLTLSSNRLTMIPEEIGDLENLTDLILYNNQLQAIPEKIGNLVNLRSCYLGGNPLITIPSTMGNLQYLVMLNLDPSPRLLAEGNSPATWGRHELYAHFRDIVVLDIPLVERMPADTDEADVYGPLDVQPIRINREWLQKAAIPTIKASTLSGDQLVVLFNEIMSHLNTTAEKQPAYVSYEALMDDYSTDSQYAGMSNDQKINAYFMPRICGFIKTLYKLPLASGETTGWQMYQAQVPQMQQALSFILTSINTDPDSDTRATRMTQLANALLHCPTGQSEGLNALVSSQIAGQIGQTAQELPSRILNHIAVKKNSSFQSAILLKTADNGQNVHWISFYRDQLKDTLGLTAALSGYEEQIGIHNFEDEDDPFNDNPYNVLSVFYELVTPARMVDWVMEIIKTPVDIEVEDYLQELARLKTIPHAPLPALTKVLSTLSNKLEMLQAGEIPEEFQQNLKNLSPAQQSTWVFNKTIETQANMNLIKQQLSPQATTVRFPSAELVEYLKSKSLLPENTKQTNAPLSLDFLQAAEKALKEIIKDNTQFRPLSTSNILGYMVGNKIINVEVPNWWQGYFTANPDQHTTATPTPTAIEAILIHMSALKVIDGYRGPE